MGLCLFIPMILPAFIRSPEVVVKEVVKVKVKYVEKEKFIKVKPEEPSIPKDDAINCLVELGLKKSIAKKKVDDLFNSRKYKTLEEFIIDAFKIT